MKTALIFKKSALPRLFTEKAIDELRKLGEVVLHDSDDLSPEAVKATIAGADIAITSWGNTALTEDILDCAPNLKFVMHAAGSVKPVVSDAMWDRGIRIAASTKPLGIGVAETALGFAISASKNFYQCNETIHNGGWNETRSNCKELFEITVGVISAGFVGRHFIKLMNNFGVEILVYDPYLTEEKAAAMGAKKAELKELLNKSDIVSIHAPNIPATNNMFNAETLTWMKKDAVLINTARGAVIDEKALYDHMAAGNLKYACLDVFNPEPPAVDNPLRTLKNVILTPHLAGLATNGQLRIGAHSVEEIKRFLNGERLECEVTKDMLATIA